MATLTSQLILSLVDKVTAPARGIAGAVATLQGRLADNNRRLDAMRGRMVEAGAVAYGLARAVSAPVKAAMEFESAMADVRKVVDFPTPAAFKAMSAQIVEMSTQIPIAATGIADIVAAAGQAGMAGDELLSFTEIAAKVGVAFDMTAGDVGEALAKIKTQLNISVADTGALADAINHLSNNSASAAPAIVDYMKRVAATGEFYGFTATQTAAIGSAMIAAGAEAEVAATSFRNVGRALAKGGSATARQASAFKRLGLDVVEVSKRFNEDAVGTLRDVIVRINQLPAHLRANALSEIFGDEARAIAPLVGQIELYDNALASVADKANYLGSSQKEYEVRAQTTANTLQLLRNKVQAVGIAIGSALLPSINSIADALGPVIMALAKFAEQNPRLTATVVALAAGLVGLRVAGIAAQFAFLWMRGGAIMAGIAGLRSLQGVAKLTSIAFWPLTASLRATRTAMIGFAASAAIAGRGGAMKIMAGSILGLLNPLRMVTTALRVMKIALIGTGIGAVLVGIAAAGTWIYNNWQGIGVAFEAFKGAFSRAIEPVMPMLQPVIDGVSSLFGWLGDLLGPIDDMNGSWAGWGIAAGTAVGEVVAAIVGLPARIAAFAGEMVTAGTELIQSLWNGAMTRLDAVIEWFNGIPVHIQAALGGVAVLAEAGAQLIQSLWDGALAKFNEFVEWVKGIPAKIKAAIGRINLSNIISWPKMPSWLGGAAEAASDNARAAGGPIVGGRTYLVGEEGPELITPSRSGYVHTAEETAAMAGSSATRAGAATRGALTGGLRVDRVIGELHVHPAPGMDEQALAEKVARTIEGAVRNALSGIQSDAEWSVA